MNSFYYKARDQVGKLMQGKVEAASVNDAAKLLRERGLVIISIKPKGFSPLSLLTSPRGVSLSDLATFTRQLSTMITAGLPITNALIILRGQSAKSLIPVIERILADVEGGTSLGAAMEKHSKVFSGVYIALIKAGEGGGVLDQVLARLADNLESQREFESKVKGALIYPVIVIVGMISVAAIMMIFVLPKLLSLFADFNADLPMSTKILIAISNFSSHYWFIVLAVIVVLVWIFRLYAQSTQGEEKIDRWKLKIPIYGPLQKEIILTEMTRTLGLLVGAGVSILEGLRIASGVVDNVLIKRSLSRASTQVEQGFALAYAFSQEPEIFPPMLYQMLAVGEETGKLDDALLKVSNVFEQESANLVRGLTAAIEPMVMIVLGLGVGFLVVAIIMPIYNLTGQF
ncbi:MAG: type II secretion system F family protein [Candidatus Blackburnbacteria bacterium]|nr:type II secretion system F family protein [Candidatus Blackburnbacteria bacterium]